MNKLIFIMWKVKLSQDVNRWIYYLRKIPFLSTVVKVTAYNSLKVKRILSVITFIASIIFAFLRNFIYVIVFLFLPAVFIIQGLAHQEMINYALHLYIVLSLFCGSIASTKSAMATKDAYIAIQIFKIAPREYEMANTIYLYSQSTFFLGVSLFLMCHLLSVDQPLLMTLVLCLYHFCLHIWGDNFEFHQFKRFPKYYKSMKILMPVVIISILLAIVPFFTNTIYPAYAFLWNPISILLGIILTYFGIRRRLHYDLYSEIYREGFNKNIKTYDMGTYMGMARFGDVQLKNNLSVDLPLKVSNLEGYQYFNKIFMIRHTSLLQRPVKIRLCYVGVILIVLTIALFTVPDTKTNWNQMLIGVIPMLVFAMYTFNITEKLVRAMFYNCDLAMLHYAYYRKKETILGNFKARLKIVIEHNLIVAFALVLGVLLLQLLFQIPLTMNYFVFSLTAIFLSIFFSTHNLSMYYLFQPFTEGLDSKNPFYSMINLVVYSISFICLQINGAPILFSFVVLFITIVYIILSFMAVYHFAPKTFRIKK